MSIAGYRALAALSAIALIVSSTCAGAFISSDILEHVPSHMFLKCGSSLQIGSDTQRNCPTVWTHLSRSLPEFPESLRHLVESSVIGAHSKGLISIPQSRALELDNVMETQFWLSGVTMTFVLEIGSSSVSHIGLSVRNARTDVQLRCGMSVKRTSLSREMLCVDSDGGVGPSTVSVAFSVSQLATFAEFEVIQVVIGREGAVDELIVSALPVFLDSQKAYLIEYRGKEVERSEMRQEEHRRAHVSTLENISLEEKPLAAPVGFYSGARVAGMVIGGVSVLVVVVILVVTMLIGGSKKVSPGKPSVAVSGLGNGSGVSGNGTGAVGGTGAPTSSNKHVVASGKSDGTSPGAHYGVGSTATLSTTASSTPGSGGGVSMVGPGIGNGNGMSMVSSMPLAGGVISASMSSAMRGAYSMSPGSDTPLESELVGQQVSTQYYESASFRPGLSAKEASGSAGQYSGSPSGATGIQQRKGAKRGQPGSGHSPESYPASGFGTKGKGKTERVALNAESLLYSPRARAPVKISNATLAALPAEPAPRVKPRYLSVHAAPIKPLPHAARNLRFRDVVPQAQAHGGTGSVNQASDASAPKGTLRRKKKHVANSSSGGLSDDLDSYLDDDSSFFDDDDDDWLDDIVEPHPDDPIYKNDDTYVEIDVERLEFVAPPAHDESVDALDSHIAALASPLSSASSLSRSNSSISASQNSKGDSNPANATSSIDARRTSAAPGSRTAMKLSKSSENLSGLSSSSSSISSAVKKATKRKSDKIESSGASSASSSSNTAVAPQPKRKAAGVTPLAVSADSISASSSTESSGKFTPTLSSSSPARPPNAVSASSSTSASPAASPAPSSKWSFAKPASGRP